MEFGGIPRARLLAAMICQLADKVIPRFLPPERAVNQVKVAADHLATALAGFRIVLRWDGPVPVAKPAVDDGHAATQLGVSLKEALVRATRGNNDITQPRAADPQQARNLGIVLW